MKAIIHRALLLAWFSCTASLATHAASRAPVVLLATRDVEIEAVRLALGAGEPVTNPAAGKAVVSFSTDATEVHAVRCGAGLVNAVMATQLMIDRSRPSVVVSVGLCAAVDDALNIGDLLLVDTFDRHDVGTHTDAGLVHGTAWYRKTRLTASDLVPDWTTFAADLDTRLGAPIPRVCLVTGDSFIRSSLKRAWIQQKLGAHAVDMSGAGIAFVAEANGVPLVVLRQVSDRGDEQAGKKFADAAESDAATLGRAAARAIEAWKARPVENTP